MHCLAFVYHVIIRHADRQRLFSPGRDDRAMPTAFALAAERTAESSTNKTSVQRNLAVV